MLDDMAINLMRQAFLINWLTVFALFGEPCFYNDLSKMYCVLYRHRAE